MCSSHDVMNIRSASEMVQWAGGNWPSGTCGVQVAVSSQALGLLGKVRQQILYASVSLQVSCPFEICGQIIYPAVIEVLTYPPHQHDRFQSAFRDWTPWC
jgi:hypothetical protein